MKKILWVAAGLTFALSSSTFAQNGCIDCGSITFSPASFAVPVFGGAGLALLGLLMGGLAFVMRRKGTSGHMAISALAVGGLVAALSGAHLIDDAIAGGSYDVTNPDGETLYLYPMSQDFHMKTGVDMIVTGIEDPVCPVNPNKAVIQRVPPSFPTCVLGTVYPDGTACTIDPCAPGGSVEF